MAKLSLTGEQFTAALLVLKKEHKMNGADFAKYCNCGRSAQTYWRKTGISGPAAVMLHTLIGQENWNKIKRG